MFWAFINDDDNGKAKTLIASGRNCVYFQIDSGGDIVVKSEDGQQVINRSVLIQVRKQKP